MNDESRTVVVPKERHAPSQYGVDAILECRSLSKSFAPKASDRAVIADLSISVSRGAFMSIVGPSGVGKTTLLRCLAGLMAPTSGQVRVNGRVITEPPPEAGVVFQDYSRSLLPWFRLRENVALPLRARGVPAKSRRTRAMDALVEVGLGGFHHYYPWQVSGGMQQRAAIARALVAAPELLLMDEPFASVDAQTRLDLEDLIRALHKREGMSIVFVTHDVDEAVYLSDRVAVLSGSPASTKQVLDIDLGQERDQILTRSQRDFVTYRATLLEAIRTAKKDV